MAAALKQLLPALAMLGSVWLPAGASAEDRPGAPLLQPRAVVIHVHADIADQRFVPDLLRRMQRSLVPPVSALNTQLDLAALRPKIGIMDAQPLIEALVRSVDWSRSADVIQVLVIADDMRLRPANYNFAASIGNPSTPYHVVVVSLARLQDRAAIGGADRNPARTAERVYKMVAKNTARVAGYAASDKCLFAFPRNVQELDALPEGFCEPDLSVLVQAGIAKRLD